MSILLPCALRHVFRCSTLKTSLPAICNIDYCEFRLSAARLRDFRRTESIKNHKKKKGHVREMIDMETQDPGYIESLELIGDMLGSSYNSSVESKRMLSEAEIDNRRNERRRIQNQQIDKLDYQNSNFLTWAAKRQIIELASNDPDTWNPDTISKCFPTSKGQVRHMLQRKHYISSWSPEDIFHHDRLVMRRLKALAAADKLPNGAPNPKTLEPGFQWLINTSKWHLLIHAGGNAELPLSERQFVEELQEQKIQKKQMVGPFEALYMNMARPEEPDQRVVRFIARCKRQQKQLLTRLDSDFNPKSVLRSYTDSGVLPTASQKEEVKLVNHSEVSSAFNMYAASSLALRDAESSALRKEEASGGQSQKIDDVSRIFEQFEVDEKDDVFAVAKTRGGKPRDGRPPLALPERSGLDNARIFKYSFRRSRRQ